MQSIDLDQFENAEEIKAWLEAGETIDLYDDDGVVAHIIPENPSPHPNERPDFAARLNADSDDRVIETKPILEGLREDRF